MKMRLIARVAMLAATFATVQFERAFASDDKLAGIHSVAVLSAIGDSLTLKEVGLMVFSNAETPVAIQDWGLDDAIEKSVAATLSGRFNVVNVPFDRDALAAEPGPRDTLWKEIRRALSASPAGNVDAYVVVLKDGADDLYGLTNQKWRGIGVYHHGGVFGLSLNAIYTLYDVVVVDARSGEVIETGSARTPQFDIFTYTLPWTPSDAALWPDPASSLTDTQLQGIKRTVYALVDESLDHALANAGLIDDSQKLTPVVLETTTQPANAQ